MDAFYERALTVTPGGAQTMSKQHARYGAGMPAFLESGTGVHVYAPDGTKFVDWIASLCAVTLGHARPELHDAMCNQSTTGGTFAMPHPLEITVGEKFLNAVGWPEGMVRWCSTGSEATEGAVRIARMATGRDLILSVGYHGWHSTWSAAKEHHPGVPEVFRQVLVDVSLQEVPLWIKTKPGQVAAVILEPCAESAPDADLLQFIVDTAHADGVLVISDEIIAGFRWHEAGAMLGTCHVLPDLVCYGKAIANGTFPIAAIVGPPDLMRHAWPVSGTANGHPIGLAAVNAVLDIYEREQPLLELHRAGRTLRHSLRGLAMTHDGTAAGLQVSGDDPRPVVKIHSEPRTNGFSPTAADLDASVRQRNNVGQTLLCQELAKRGVLWHPAGAGNAMVGHGAVLAETVDAFAGALAVVAEAMQSDTPETWLVGAPSASALAVRP